MANYTSCPWCGKKAKDAFSSNYLTLLKCNECKTEFCNKCKKPNCPECGSSKYTATGKIYAQKN